MRMSNPVSLFPCFSHYFSWSGDFRYFRHAPVSMRYIPAMRKFAVAALLLVICAAPAFAHLKGRFSQKAPEGSTGCGASQSAAPNESLNFKNAPKHKMPKHSRISAA